MKLILSENPWPDIWREDSPEIHKEYDISFNKGRIKAKLLFFLTPSLMRKWWKKNLKSDLTKRALGAVNGLHREVKKGGKTYLEVDPIYYCVIGLSMKHLSLEIIAHECVHAAFAYEKRRTRNPWDKCIRQYPEEAICYPTGILTVAVIEACEEIQGTKSKILVE